MPARPYRRPNLASLLIVGLLLADSSVAQVNSGSDGSDGALSPPNGYLVIDMHDHPTGIYQYTTVNISGSAIVQFIPNAANTPVVWLVQGDCTIGGFVYLDGQTPTGRAAGAGGPGGFDGGEGYLQSDPTYGGAGLGPGGGTGSSPICGPPGPGAFGTPGWSAYSCVLLQATYGSSLLLPIVGGSGGGGRNYGGGGGGGAILIAVSGTLNLLGNIRANGGCYDNNPSGYGSGGAIRLVASNLSGNGYVNAKGGCDSIGNGCGGQGRVRLEATTNNFSGQIDGSYSIGYPNIILLPSNQEPRLVIENVAGVVVDPNPQTAPNVRVPGLQSNPINIVVRCVNVAMNSQITVDVKPLNGAVASATGTNSSGTLASSTAVVSLNMPRGEGTIQARTTTTVLLGSADDGGRRKKEKRSLYETGLAANGERFAKAEITSMLGGGQQVVYVTESGKRFTLGAEVKKPTIAKASTKKG